MKRELIKNVWADMQAYSEREIVLGGWARSIRDSRAFGFIDLYDGSCFKTMQVVFEREKIANYDEIAKLNVGSAVVVRGKVVLTPEMKQPFELKAIEITVEGTSTPDYPCKKSVIPWSTCGSRPICVRVPTSFLRSSVFAVRWLTPFIPSSTTVDSSTFTRH